MGNNSLSNTEKSLRSIAKRYENVKYSVGLAVLFLMNGTSAFSDTNAVQEIDRQKEVAKDNQAGKTVVKETKKEKKQASQKLKASWVNMQFGANDMYSNYFAAPKAKVEKTSVVKSEKTVLVASADNTASLPMFAKLLTDIEETTETRTEVLTTIANKEAAPTETATPTMEEIKASKQELRSSVGNLQDKIENTKKIKSAKDNKNLKVALVLSGGGVKGYAHLGVLRVLERENIKIDYITGTSIGALIGTLYSIGYSVDEIEKFLDDINVSSFLETVTDNTNLSLEKKESLKKYSAYLSFDNELNFSFPKGLKGTGEEYLILKKMLGKYEYMDNFDNFPIPLRIVATNLNTGETKAFSKGDVAKTLIASMAIPSIFEPMKIDGEIYVDGLVTRNLPVEEAYDMGADIVIASDIGAPVVEKDDYNILSVMSQANTIQASNITKVSREKASILISPDIKDISAIASSKKEEK